MKESRSKIKIPIYDSEIHLVVTNDIDNKCKRIYKKRNWKDLYIDDAGATEGCFLYDDNDIGCYYILLTEKPSLTLILHETLHATFIILNHHGVIYHKDNHESFTYLHGHIFLEVYNRTNK